MTIAALRVTSGSGEREPRSVRMRKDWFSDIARTYLDGLGIHGYEAGEGVQDVIGACAAGCARDGRHRDIGLFGAVGIPPSLKFPNSCPQCTYLGILLEQPLANTYPKRVELGFEELGLQVEEVLHGSLGRLGDTLLHRAPTHDTRGYPQLVLRRQGGRSPGQISGGEGGPSGR